MILVDTCVLIDVAEQDSRWAEWSTHQLGLWNLRGPLVINPMVFAEWSTLFAHLGAVQSAVAAYGLIWQDMPQAALFLAAQAHRRYRRGGGTKAMVLADFLIGAHARVNRWPLLTRDPRRFTHYFDGLEIVHPGLSPH